MRQIKKRADGSGKLVKAVIKLFPLQKRKLPLNQPENCLVLLGCWNLGWNVAVTTRPMAHSSLNETEREAGRRVVGEKEKDRQALGTFPQIACSVCTNTTKHSPNCPFSFNLATQEYCNKRQI